MKKTTARRATVKKPSPAKPAAKKARPAPSLARALEQLEDRLSQVEQRFEDAKRSFEDASQVRTAGAGVQDRQAQKDLTSRASDMRLLVVRRTELLWLRRLLQGGGSAAD